MRNVTITGTAAPGAIATNPASVDFGPVCRNGSATANVDVYASNVADVKFMDASAGGLFAATSNDKGKTLGGNHSNDATVSVSITAPATAPLGDAMMNLDLLTNLPSPHYPVAMHAKVLDGGANPTASPAMVPFGTTKVATPTSPKTVVIANCTGHDLMVTGVNVVGPDQSSFLIVSPDSTHLTGPLPNTQQQAYAIIMLPTSHGRQDAQLQIDYDMAPSTTVPLQGDAEIQNNARETYYACGVGGGAAAPWPIALALGWLARRRRRR
jgi:hypothetical protein